MKPPSSTHRQERVDDKVVTQFARATAPRVTDLKIAFRGVDVGEIAPAEPTSLVDGEPFTVFGTYEAGGAFAVEIRGMYEGEKFYLEVPFDLPDSEERPAVTKLWAQARIRDLERAVLAGRRADSMKDRIVKLAKAYGVSSKYTSFVVVEKRTGDRRVNEQAETRVVPVNAPADWDMFKASRSRSYGAPRRMMGAMAGPMSPAPMAPPRASSMGGNGAPRPAAGMPLPPPAARGGGFGGGATKQARSVPLSQRDDAMDTGRAPPMEADRGFEDDLSPSPIDALYERAEQGAVFGHGALEGAQHARAPSADPITATLERQAASGLWEESGRNPIEVTVDALLVLVRLGVSTSHAVHGAQTKKAVDALLEALAGAQGLDPKLAELALAVLWLLSTGRRTRIAIKDATSRRAGLEGLAAVLGRDDDVRARVERIAQETRPMC